MVGEIPIVKELWLLDFDIVWKKGTCSDTNCWIEKSTCGTTNGSAEQPAEFSRVFVFVFKQDGSNKRKENKNTCIKINQKPLTQVGFPFSHSIQTLNSTLSKLLSSSYFTRSSIGNLYNEQTQNTKP